MGEIIFPDPSPSVIWDTSPAGEWAETYPTGNGRIGAMIHGRATDEIISLNHDLLWRSYLKRPQYGTYRDMPQIKQLCGQGNFKEAEKLLCQTIPSRGAIYINPFVPLCDLYLTMFFHKCDPGSYRRVLDLRTGISYVEYSSGDVLFRRECYCPCGSDYMILHLTSSVPGTLSGEVSLSRMPEFECRIDGHPKIDGVFLNGRFEEGKLFACAAKLINRNGRLTFGKRDYGITDDQNAERRFGLRYIFNRDELYSRERGASACFDSCDELYIVFMAVTDDTSDQPTQLCHENFAKINTPEEIDILKEQHIACFSAYYDRVKLNISSIEEHEEAVSLLINRCRDSGKTSAALCEKLFNMARYIAITSGMPQPEEKPEKAPINLQGIWCRDTSPAWESDYHPDLNIEMCYWPMIHAGLAEFTEPLLCWVERLMPQAENCAADIYGCRGAAFSGCCDPHTLGGTDNVGAGWLGASAWIAMILWQYYKHCPDTELLGRIYAVMTRFAEFYDEMFTEKDGVLTFPFGSSPEMPILADGHEQWLSSASSCDLELVRELYINLADAARLLNKNAEEKLFTQTADKIQMPRIGADGALLEWSEYHQEAQPGHRHRSPFVGLCPGDSYSLLKTPVYTDAMYKLLKKRHSAGNSVSTSFSYAWDAQILARLDAGNEAYAQLDFITKIHLLDNLMIATNDFSGSGGGITWFPGIKVIQVDAQLCLISAITEMIIREEGNSVVPLSSLPDSISSGSLCGINGHNGFIYDISWNNSSLERLIIHSKFGGTCSIIKTPACSNLAITGPLNEDISLDISDNLISFNTRAGHQYIAVPQKIQAVG